jgi:hypothetical protein
MSSNTDSTRPAHPSTDETIEAQYTCLERLADLEDDLRHADLGAEERCELEDRVRRLRRKLAR